MRGRACPRCRQARQAAHAGQPSAQRCAIESRGRQLWRSRNNPWASAHPEAKLPYIRHVQDGRVGTGKATQVDQTAARARSAAFGAPNRDVSELRSILYHEFPQRRSHSWPHQTPDQCPSACDMARGAFRQALRTLLIRRNVSNVPHVRQVRAAPPFAPSVRLPPIPREQFLSSRKDCWANFLRKLEVCVQCACAAHTQKA